MATISFTEHFRQRTGTGAVQETIDIKELLQSNLEVEEKAVVEKPAVESEDPQGEEVAEEPEVEEAEVEELTRAELMAKLDELGIEHPKAGSGSGKADLQALLETANG